MAQNKYFDRFEFYNLGSYINDKYVLKRNSKKLLKEYLRENTYYTEEKFSSMSDIQLYQTYARIKATIRLYKQEITKFVEDNPEIFAYQPTVITREQYANLNKLTYNELSKLRQNLHIDKRYKPLVLVKDTTPKTIKTGVQEEFHQYTISEYIENKKSESDNEINYDILITTKQGYLIFGEDFKNMTSDQLKGFGYVLAVSEEDNKRAIRMHEEIKETMVSYMADHDFISPAGEVYDKDTLMKLNIEDLKTLYVSFATFYQGMPNFDNIKKRTFMI